MLKVTEQRSWGACCFGVGEGGAGTAAGAGMTNGGHPAAVLSFTARADTGSGAQSSLSLSQFRQIIQSSGDKVETGKLETPP